jgi:hypothetical protein
MMRRQGPTATISLLSQAPAMVENRRRLRGLAFGDSLAQREGVNPAKMVDLDQFEE